VRPRTKQKPVGELSQAVKKLREALGQTQQQFAQTLNTAITTIARYETGRTPKGQFLSRLEAVATQNNQIELAKVFRDGLLRQLGSWDSTGYTLDLEPRDDTERLYVASVLAVLRNEQYAKVIPKLNRALKQAATTSIDKFDWFKRNQQAKQTAKEMARAGHTPDEIATKVDIPVDEVRQFLNWLRVEDLVKSQHR